MSAPPEALRVSTMPTDPSRMLVEYDGDETLTDAQLLAMLRARDWRLQREQTKAAEPKPWHPNRSERRRLTGRNKQHRGRGSGRA